MIENFIISTLDGTIVFCRYYNDYGKKQREDWEQVMYKITHKTWNNAKNGNYELAVDGLVVFEILLRFTHILYHF